MNRTNDPEVNTIRAGKKISLLKVFIKYHELIFFLSWRDILVRYKQTVFGLLWAIMRPFLLIVVFTLLFGQILGLSKDTDIPYPLIVFAGLLPWQFFATSLQQISDSLILNQNIISKVYFPRIIIPISSTVTSMVDFFISAIMLALLMVWFQYTPDQDILFLPLFIVFLFSISLGIGLIIAALNVSYRDFRYITPFAIQLGFYASPVAFDVAVIPENWRLIYSLNPMVGIIEGFRFSLLDDRNTLYWPSVAISAAISFGCLLLGLKVFQTLQSDFADRI